MKILNIIEDNAFLIFILLLLICPMYMFTFQFESLNKSKDEKIKEKTAYVIYESESHLWIYKLKGNKFVIEHSDECIVCEE